MSEREPAQRGSAERRVDRGFAWRSLCRNALLSIPPLVVLCLLWPRWEAPDPAFWLMAALFVLWIAGWMLADLRLLRRYRCPTCGLAIRRPTIVDRGPGDPVLYYCRRCDVEWDTRARESDG